MDKLDAERSYASIDALYDKIEKAEEALKQIAIICTKNMDRDKDHRSALELVREIANRILEN